MTIRFIYTLTLISLVFGCSKQRHSTPNEAPTGDNAPHWFGLETMRYDNLPENAFLKTVPWPGDYWATARGGIAYRWQQNETSYNYKEYLYSLPNQDETASFESKDINRLSPAEKYDLWQGHTDLNAVGTATRAQRDFMLDAAENAKGQTGKDTIPDWTGICNGWSLAALNEKQPQNAVTLKAPNDAEITFYPGDLKALMSQIYFDYQPEIIISRLGSMCQEKSPEKDRQGRIKDLYCRDVNPMSFHLALAGYLAKNKSFVYDTDAEDEVWNQPVYGYDNLVIGEPKDIPEDYKHAARGASQIVEVIVDLHYIVEAPPEKTGYDEKTVKDFIESKTYIYTLEIDDEGIVLGGEWNNDSPIPDFMWKPSQKPSEELLGSSYPISYKKMKKLFDLAK